MLASLSKTVTRRVFPMPPRASKATDAYSDSDYDEGGDIDMDGDYDERDPKPRPNKGKGREPGVDRKSKGQDVC
jgi:hypothetical protein